MAANVAMAVRPGKLSSGDSSHPLDSELLARRRNDLDELLARAHRRRRGAGAAVSYVNEPSIRRPRAAV